MMMLINCSRCQTQLQLRPGTPSICCAICNAVTYVTVPRELLNAPRPSPAMPNPFPGLWGGQNPVPAVAAGGAGAAGGGVGGRKKALICGVSYRGSENELEGCANDAKYMKYLLINRFQFPESNIIMLTEDETDPDRLPTMKNIKIAMNWLVKDCQPGDSLFFHFSGHGSQQEDTNGDEADGIDETICPMDCETEGMIVDDEINHTIVRPLPRGVKLHAIIDACHSGTVLDLPYLCKMNKDGQYDWEDQRIPGGSWKGTNGGEVICFSGCHDDQTSADTSLLSKVTSTGAMTYCFIQAIEHGFGATYGSILNSMRSTIRNTTNASAGGRATSLASMLLDGIVPGLEQEPQLTSNEIFDVYAKPFSL